MLIGYARVSTDDQTPDLQLDALKAAGCEKIFTDKASGAKADRPGLTDALGYAREGDTLVVWRLDRMGRSLKDLLHRLEELEKSGIQLKSLQESIDTSTAVGRMVFQVAGAFAEFERNLIRERTQAGLKAARSRGRKGGRPAKDAGKIKAALALYAEKSMTIAEIEKATGVSKSTLYRHLAH